MDNREKNFAFHWNSILQAKYAGVEEKEYLGAEKLPMPHQAICTTLNTIGHSDSFTLQLANSSDYY